MKIKKSDLMEVIKEVVRQSLKESNDKWIQGAVNPEHKGYCTPMTKSTCTPKRKALALRFKKGLAEMGYSITKKSQGGTSVPKDYKTINKDMRQMECGITSETAFKKEGPSLKTFDDSPQFPDAVNNPENR